MEKQTILLIEDEAEIREGIRILLSGENYSILEAPDGPTALSMMNDQIDLVIPLPDPAAEGLVLIYDWLGAGLSLPVSWKEGTL